MKGFVGFSSGRKVCDNSGFTENSFGIFTALETISILPTGYSIDSLSFAIKIVAS
jgi:hypothetical protein